MNWQRNENLKFPTHMLAFTNVFYELNLAMNKFKNVISGCSVSNPIDFYFFFTLTHASTHKKPAQQLHVVDYEEKLTKKKYHQHQCQNGHSVMKCFFFVNRSLIENIWLNFFLSKWLRWAVKLVGVNPVCCAYFQIPFFASTYGFWYWWFMFIYFFFFFFNACTSHRTTIHVFTNTHRVLFTYSYDI